MTTETQIIARPATLTWFKRIYVGSLAFGLLTLPLHWSEAKRLMEAEGLSAYLDQAMPPLVAMQLAMIAVIYFIVHLIVDQGRTIPKWLFLGFFICGLVMYPAGTAHIDLTSSIGIASLIQMIVQTLALPLLFTASARAWFAQKRAERAQAKAMHTAAPDLTPAG
jgi:hypothetical protein